MIGPFNLAKTARSDSWRLEGGKKRKRGGGRVSASFPYVLRSDQGEKTFPKSEAKERHEASQPTPGGGIKKREGRSERGGAPCTLWVAGEKKEKRGDYSLIAQPTGETPSISSRSRQRGEEKGDRRLS